MFHEILCSISFPQLTLLQKRSSQSSHHLSNRGSTRVSADKFKGHAEDLKVFTIYGHGSHIGDVTGTV